MRNQGKDTTKLTFDVNDGYRGEAFGIMRTLVLFGYMEYGADNVVGGAKHWFSLLEHEVLDEEGFMGSNKCDYCYERYHHDGARPRPL